MIDEYNIKDFIISLPFLTILLLAHLAAAIDIIIALSSVVLFLILGTLSLKKINSKITNLFHKNVVLFQRSQRNYIQRSVNQFIEEHNEFCHTFLEYNRFWSKVYLVFLLTIFPNNLMMFHQVLFEQLQLNYRIIFTSMAILMILSLYLLQFGFAYICKQIHKTTKQLSQLQWRLNGWPFRLNNKIKLMSYFERLSSQRKIGLSLGPTVVLTFPVFHQVLNFYMISFFIYFYIFLQFIVRYIRYFILTHKFGLKMSKDEK